MEQGRLNNRFGQKETKPIFKGINTIYGRLFLQLLDINIVITTTSAEEKFVFSSKRLPKLH